MKQKAHEMGVPGGMDPFISMSFLALTGDTGDSHHPKRALSGAEMGSRG